MIFQVLSNNEWAVLDIPVLASTIAADAGQKLGLRENPTSAFLVSFLEKTPPRDEVQAKKYFSLMANRISGITLTFNVNVYTDCVQIFLLLSYTNCLSCQWCRLGKRKIMVFSYRTYPPSQCFFGQEGKEGFHSKLFVYIDFGTSANSFLSTCGSKREPTVEEITLMLLADAHNFYQLAGGRPDM